MKPTLSLLSTLLSIGGFLACTPAEPPVGHEDHDEEAHEAPDAHVELTPAQVQSAGIEVKPAAPGQVSRHLTLPAVVAANADALSHVNPKAPGIVRTIEKRLGDRVEAGELLCVIDSAELGAAVAAFVRAHALVQAGERTLERETRLFAGRLETAERVLGGAVEMNRSIQAREQELQDRAVSTIRPLLEADKALRASELEREHGLSDLRAERDVRLLALEVELDERRIDRDAAGNALRAIGIDPTALESDPDPALLAGSYPIHAPLDGVVSGRHITAGEFVDATTKLYTLEDLSRVWIVASVFEEQIRAVRTGQTGRIRLDAFPGRTFEARVALVGYEVDPESRALGVRLELENPRLEDWPEAFPLRPGMFGSVDLVTETIAAPVVLPEDAIVHGTEGEFVFVKRPDGAFERRAVVLGPPSGAVVEVRSGVEPGEPVVVAGTFHLESARRRGELGGGHEH